MENIKICGFCDEKIKTESVLPKITTDEIYISIRGVRKYFCSDTCIRQYFSNEYYQFDFPQKERYINIVYVRNIVNIKEKNEYV